MAFVQRRNRLTTHFSECIHVVKQRMTVHRLKFRVADCTILGRQTRGNLRLLDQGYRMNGATRSNLILWSLPLESWNLSFVLALWCFSVILPQFCATASRRSCQRHRQVSPYPTSVSLMRGASWQYYRHVDSEYWRQHTPRSPIL